MWYIYTTEYYSAIKKNGIIPLAATWMDPEIITLSEVSQKEKDKFHVILLCCCSQSWPTFATSWTIDCQPPLSMGLSGQEYWSGLPFPSPGDLSDPGINPESPALQAVSLLLSHQGSPWYYLSGIQNMTQTNFLMKKKQTTRHRGQTCDCQEGWRSGSEGLGG